jgi:NADH-quinone oxidoreductase subunit N
LDRLIVEILAQQSAWSGLPIGEHLALFSPMLALVATMLAVVACPLIAGRSARTIGGIAAVGVLAAFLLALGTANRVAGAGISGLSPLAHGGMLIADNLSIAFQLVLIAFLGAVMGLWWIGSASTERNAPEFLILLLGSALGMALMASTTNLLMIVVAVETASLPSYAIVGFDKRDRTGAEASLKYMIFGAVCAAIMLYGASLLYGLVGSLGAADIAAYTVDAIAVPANRLVLSMGLLCFLAGIAFKISAVPFHFWCPDAFEGAKIEVTTWLSVASKAAGLVLLIRLVLVFVQAVRHDLSMPLIEPLAWVIGMMAAVTCTVGNFAAYWQRSVKRLLAYSSIAHAGYMMMAAAVFLHPQAGDAHAGLTALLMYVVIYLFMNLGAFGVTALVIWETGSDKIEAFTGLARRAPWLAVPLIVCLMSLIGLPPFAGFLGKWWVLVALGSLKSTLGWILVFAAVVNTLISVYYYVRLVVQMALKDDGQPALRASAGGLTLVNGCAVALLALFVLASPLKSFGDRFARNLFQPTAQMEPRPAVAAVSPGAG